MIFDDSSDHFFTYDQPFQSPDLQPISLPMPGYDKAALEGMIDFQSAAAAFPNSNAFGQYLQPYARGFQLQQPFNTQGHELELDYYSDSDIGYPYEIVEQKEPVHISVPEHYAPLKVSSGNAQPTSRKRKASPTPEYAELQQPRKKVAVSHVQLQDQGEQYNLPSQPSPYASYVATPNAGYAHGQPHLNNSPRSGHHHSVSNASQISLTAPSPHTPAWSPSFTTVKTEQSPRAPMTPAPRPASASSPQTGTLPKLVRTSTLPQQSSPAVSGPIGVHTQTFNPYSMYPQNKASLRLNGDLDGVALTWTDEQLEARRKLIVFTRSQTGSIIDANFKEVAPADWQRSDITVNCIWWTEKSEAFVTSVDTIALLEQLVAVRFTVEEKNRIRRNLEGFRPLTVSKAKADSEDFFKVIMGFPNPKPRNIEKDVKVFPWKILAHALKKIIGKYSASYSSTASTLVTPANSVYATTENSADYPFEPVAHQDVMPYHMPPGMPQAVPQRMPNHAYDSSMLHSHMSAPVTTATSGLSLQVPNISQAYGPIPPYAYEQPMHMVAHPMQMSHPLTAPPQHMPGQWGYEYPQEQHLGPLSAPASAYPHGHYETFHH